MNHYFCGNGIQVPTVLLTFFPVLLQKQDYHLLFRLKSNSGAINVFVGIIILIQYSTDIICKCDGEEAKSLAE